MAKYLINRNLALRSWENAPYACYDRVHRLVWKVSQKEYLLLLECDGMQEVEECPELEGLLRHGMIEKAEEGSEEKSEEISKEKRKEEGLSDWQLPRFYSNPMYCCAEIEITERCNYNCLHCFNAADLNVSRNQLSIEQIRRYFGQLREVGVQSVLLTGGEPMLHPDFFEILKEASKNEIEVDTINTNGAFLTQESLDRIKALGIKPIMRISYDGIGFHDWMRQSEGAEKKALDAIRLCIENGFKVWINMNANRKNKDSLAESIRFLDRMGVWKVRVIRTTEAPRWIQTSGDACLTWDEYYDMSVKLAKDYYASGGAMYLEFWGFFSVNPKRKFFRATPVRYWEGKNNLSEYLCQGSICIAADGYLYPCLKMSGAFKSNGICIGDLEKNSVKELISDGPFCRLVTKTVKDKRDGNDRCKNCPFLENCGGGCPAISLICHGSYCGPSDPFCIFFRDNYYSKIKEALPGFKPFIPMDEQKDTTYLKRQDYRPGELLKINPKDFMA